MRACVRAQQEELKEEEREKEEEGRSACHAWALESANRTYLDPTR